MGFEAGSGSITTRLTTSDEPIPIYILVEDIPAEDSYRFAVAELIRQQFSADFRVSPTSAPISLYITGSSVSKTANMRVVDISVHSIVPHHFQINKRKISVVGNFVLADAGKTLTNYSDQEATQIVREVAYKTLSEALKKLKEAEELP